MKSSNNIGNDLEKEKKADHYHASISESLQATVANFCQIAVTYLLIFIK